MRKILVLFAVGVVLAVAAWGVGNLGAQAQMADIEPVPYNPSNCTSARYDLNGDGVLNKKDVLYFDEFAAPCLDRYGMNIPGSVCEPKLDVNRDGKVDRYDLDYLYRFILSCLYPVRPNDNPRSPVVPTLPPSEP